MTVTTPSAVPTAAYENPGAANKAEPPRDYWGRYRLPHPNDENGKQYGYQRVTTFAKVLDDTYNLDKWKTRQTVLGLLKRPDLLALAATITEPDSAQGKKDLDEICEKAQEAAGTSVKANLGTALHSYCEQLLSGASGDTIPQQFHADLLAYRRELSRLGIVELPYYTERVVFNDSFDVSGRFDRIVQLPDGTLAVLDIKTRDGDLDLSWSSIAIQLATYAKAKWIRNYETSRWEPMPNVRTDIALVVHLPVGRGEAHVYQVNINAGWWGARIAAEGQAWRKTKHLAAPFIPEHLPKPLEHPTPEQLQIGSQPAPQVPINPAPDGAVDPFAAAAQPEHSGTPSLAAHVAVDPSRSQNFGAFVDSNGRAGMITPPDPQGNGDPGTAAGGPTPGWLSTPQEAAAATPQQYTRDPFAGIPAAAPADPFAVTAPQQPLDPQQFVATAHVGYDASGTEWKFGPGVTLEQAKANGIVYVDRIPLEPGPLPPAVQDVVNRVASTIANGAAPVTHSAGGALPLGFGATATSPGPVNGGRVAFSSAKQANISLNPDGTENAAAFVKPHEFQGDGLTCAYCSLGSGDTRANHREQPTATDQQPGEKRGPGRPAKPPLDPKTATVDELADLPKAKLQDLLRGLDPQANLARQRKNLAAEIVRLRDAMTGGQPNQHGYGTVTQQTGVTGEDVVLSPTVSNAPGPVPPDPTPQYPADRDPFAVPQPEAHGAPVLDENYYLGQIQLAQSKKDLSNLWQHAQNNKVPWTDNLDNAGKARMQVIASQS